MLEIKSCMKCDEIYPQALKELKNAPETVYYIGDISICNDSVVAVIGKRDSDGRKLCISERIGKTIAQGGYIVLNGLAVGCDEYAIKGAISVGGKVIAVMPRGLDEIYPLKNKELAELIVKNGGCLISEYPCGIEPEKFRFIERDRLQAALSSKIIVVDTNISGGTMQTVKSAQKLGKSIGCIIDTEKNSTGNEYLVGSRNASEIIDNNTLNEFIKTEIYSQLKFNI